MTFKLVETQPRSLAPST